VDNQNPENLVCLPTEVGKAIHKALQLKYEEGFRAQGLATRQGVLLEIVGLVKEWERKHLENRDRYESDAREAITPAPFQSRRPVRPWRESIILALQEHDAAELLHVYVQKLEALR